MEIKKGKLIINKSGGTAGVGSNTYRVTLPNKWIKAMKIGAENRELELSFNGKSIIISPIKKISTYIKDNNSDELYYLKYYKDHTLCTRIIANYSKKEIIIENEDVSIINRAFGKNEHPTWNDYTEFLKDRCIPQSRMGIKYYLNAIGLSEYDPLSIILKTHGKMAEDHHWLEVEKYDCKTDNQ